MKLDKSDIKRYVVAHNNINIYHAVILYPQQELETGQPRLDVFLTKQEALDQFGDKISFEEE